MDRSLVLKISLPINRDSPEVWDALVNPEKIRKYLFGTEASSDWKIGSPIIFTGTWKGKSYRDQGTIQDLIPGRKLQYTYWSSLSGLEDIPDSYTLITFELEPGENTTLLSLTQAGFPTEDSYRHSELNWRMVLNQIRDLLEGNT